MWGHDLNGNLDREVGQQTFNKNTSRVWKHERKEDNALYSAAGAPALSPPLPARYMLPDRDSVVDLGFMKIPILDLLKSAKQNAFQFDAFFATNLKGFSNAKNLRFWVYEGNSTLPKNLIVGPLGGSSIDRRSGTLLGKPSFARYWLSYVSLGRHVHWERLRQRLERPINEGKSVRGRPYDYVMRITVVVSGFLTENGPRQKASNVYYLVYTKGEERDFEAEAVPF